jgi:hypothetical protein
MDDKVVSNKDELLKRADNLIHNIEEYRKEIHETTLILQKYHEVILDITNSKLNMYPLSSLPFTKNVIIDALKVHVRASIITGKLTTQRKDEFLTYFRFLAHFIEDKKVMFLERYAELVNTGGFEKGKDDEEFALSTAYAKSISGEVEKAESSLTDEFFQYYLDWKDLRIQE